MGISFGKDHKKSDKELEMTYDVSKFTLVQTRTEEHSGKISKSYEGPVDKKSIKTIKAELKAGTIVRVNGRQWIMPDVNLYEGITKAYVSFYVEADRIMNTDIDAILAEAVTAR